MTIYRSRTNVPGSILEHHKRETFEQHVAPQLLEAFAMAEDPFLSLPTEQGKEVLVVAKRGRDAKIMEEVSKPPYNEDYDIRALALNMTWSQIRENYTEGGDDDDEEIYGGSRAPRRMGRLDIYGRNAYEINWADSKDIDIAAGGGQSQDWDEHAAVNLLRSRLAGL